MARENAAVNPSDQTSILGQGTGSRRVRSGNQAQQAVSGKKGRADGSPGLSAEPYIQESRAHPGKTDTAENAVKAEIGEIQLEQSVIYDSEQNQDSRPLEYLAVDMFPVLLKRERESDSGDEKEQRKYRVVLSQPIPFRVMHLNVEPAVGCSEDGAQG